VHGDLSRTSSFATMEICIKIHERGGEKVLAACDAELLGKVFEEGKLRIHITEEFYFGRHVSESEFLEALENVDNANLVGERVISSYSKKNPCSPLHIDKVPHIQIYKI
jgi:uncharacterized protein